jgi:hypothetical protein
VLSVEYFVQTAIWSNRAVSIVLLRTHGLSKNAARSKVIRQAATLFSVPVSIHEG